MPPAHSEIYQFDLEPLGDRKPLLLIHGGGGEHQHVFRWDKVMERFSEEPAFNQRYKVYFLRYDSKAHLEQTVPESQQCILKLFEATGQPITVMALSLGGNVAQYAIVDPEVDKAINLVFALGTPFHGSPLFSADWFEYSILKGHKLPFARFIQSLDYRLYFHFHKNYQQDLRWDDSDSLIPRVGYFKSRLPLGPHGDLTLKRDSNKALAHVNARVKVDKSKFITYAGYLVNPYILSNPWRRREQTILAPLKFITTSVPAQLGREQPVLKVLNKEISQVDPAPESTPSGHAAHVYDFNDGITPLSSAVFLSPEAEKFHPLLHETDLPALREAIDVRKARVFRNIDHVTFVDGSPPHLGSKLLRDELHPEDGWHHIFDWMLSELLGAEANKSSSAH